MFEEVEIPLEANGQEGRFIEEVFTGIPSDIASLERNYLLSDDDLDLIGPHRHPENPRNQPYRVILRCAVRRCQSSAGANPARQLSLQPVAVGADDGGNNIV